MGLFKNLLDVAVKAASDKISSDVKKAIGVDEVKAAAEKLANQVKDALGVDDLKPASKPAAPAFDYGDDEPECEVDAAYFREILATEFPEYEVSENVPVTTLAGDAADSFQLYKTRPYQVYKAEWGEPYSFVMSQGGTPKGVVMIGSGHCHDEKVKFLIARMYAKKLGLPYINFYTQMPNKKEYVVARIHKFLG